MAIAGLRAGLEALGHRVDSWRPRDGRGEAGTSAGIRHLARRLSFNLRLRRELPEERYDLVVGFDLDGFALPSPPRSRRVTCLKGVAADELRFESGLPRARLRLHSVLERRAARRARQVVVPSRYSRRRAMVLYGLPADRVQVVPEGIDPEVPVEPDLEGGTAGPVILSVARQYRRKNTADLLRAMPGVLTHHPDARLRVVGGGPELPALRRLQRDLSLATSVDLLGELPSREAVRREYGRADLFCLPSLQEGFGIVFLEAMAAGLPVVACRAGAVPEVVDHGSTGILCPPGRPRPLSRALRSLLADPDRREAMGRAGRRHVLRYAWTRVARIFLDQLTARSVRDGV